MSGLWASARPGLQGGGAAELCKCRFMDPALA